MKEANRKANIAAAIIRARNSRRPLGISQAAARARRALGKGAHRTEVAMLANQLIDMSRKAAA